MWNFRNLPRFYSRKKNHVCIATMLTEHHTSDQVLLNMHLRRVILKVNRRSLTFTLDIIQEKFHDATMA